MKNWIAALLFIFIETAIFGQQKDSVGLTFFNKSIEEKQIGMNMTPLLVQLIPFNRANPTISGPYSVNFKKYKNGNCVRYGFGANFSLFSDNDADRIFNAHIGWDRRRRSFGERFAMYQGVDLIFSIGGPNVPGQSFSDLFANNDFVGGIGIAPLWGFEYALTPYLSVSTETALHVGLISTLGIFFIPPTAIQLNYRIFKN